MSINEYKRFESCSGHQQQPLQKVAFRRGLFLVDCVAVFEALYRVCQESGKKSLNLFFRAGVDKQHVAKIVVSGKRTLSSFEHF
jgi:hypothetical protein